ncbi:MFS transporter [Flavitalea sp. BT771]|uniref:MFS transporter n=1 Tax=Flavitalea sp. BT771 TaxID=3063329 RepID=UPI0026E4799E|nr:MFS transporter [Flavitalea sp. BT771]MDO6429797.1 MFS transporter [Flavitalea sp. BT771]MDV6218075.1 MFS transporter [Flavitalea sp. BT771]
MEQKKLPLFNLAVIVGALGYFVDIYDLLLFSIIRVPSLRSLGLNADSIAKDGLRIINIQMLGLLVGGIIWGVLGDKKGRLKVLYASIILYSLGNIANGFVQNVTQYEIVRFITGLGLAGELGAGITLVSELMPKERRGLATSLVAGIGLSGAVFAYFIRVWLVGPNGEGWRTCYFIGGGLGFLLLFLRVGVLESGMFKSIETSEKVRKGDFLMLFTNGKRLKKYLTAILIALPNWFVIGILISFSDKFAAKLNIKGAVDPGKAVMVAYAAISIGDVLIGFVSQWLRSRKKSLYIFNIITVLSIFWFFSLDGQSSTTMYVVCACLGFGTGFWAMFVTMAAEQFGTNIRATVATTAPNMARGSLNLVSLLFVSLQGNFDYLKSAWITGIIVFTISFISLILTEETFGKDLDYIEPA